MNINKETMKQETYRVLNTLFQLKEIEKIALKDVEIHSIEDHENIAKGLEQCYHDCLSDVDIVVYLRLNPIDFNKDTPIYKHYLTRLGIEQRIFGIAFVERMEAQNNKEGMRICLKSGFRMDLTCFVRCDADADPLPAQEDIGNVGQNAAEEYVDIGDSNRFWFVSIQALAKLLRKDYLIADHLTYMMLMDGLVIQMKERDAVYHTNFHRYGYSEQLLYRDLDVTGYSRFIDSGDEIFHHIAENLCRAVLSYDKLALLHEKTYESHAESFFEIWDCYISAER